MMKSEEQNPPPEIYYPLSEYIYRQTEGKSDLRSENKTKIIDLIPSPL